MRRSLSMNQDDRLGWGLPLSSFIWKLMSRRLREPILMGEALHRTRKQSNDDEVFFCDLTGWPFHWAGFKKTQPGGNCGCTPEREECGGCFRAGVLKLPDVVGKCARCC